MLVAGAPEPGFDAVQPLDAKAVHPAPAGVDPRIVMLVAECVRHAKAIGGWGAGRAALAALGLEGEAGVVAGDDAATTLAQVQALMAGHRVWERFPTRV